MFLNNDRFSVQYWAELVADKATEINPADRNLVVVYATAMGRVLALARICRYVRACGNDDIPADLAVLAEKQLGQSVAELLQLAAAGFNMPAFDGTLYYRREH